MIAMTLLDVMIPTSGFCRPLVVSSSLRLKPLETSSSYQRPEIRDQRPEAPMDEQDPRDQSLAWTFPPNVLSGERFTFEVITTNGHRRLKRLERAAWNALAREPAEADARGESIELVLQRCRLATDAAHERQMAYVDMEERNE